MSKDFLKTETPEIWTKEAQRNIQYTNIENYMIDAELRGDFGALLSYARIYLRFQMEVMEQKVDVLDEEGKPEKDEAGRIRKKTLYGMETPLYQTLIGTIRNLESRWRNLGIRKVDPMARANDTTERYELIEDIQNLMSTLFHNNTALGLNYRKKNDPMKAAYY